MTNETRAAFYAAFAKAQGAIEGAIKNSTNPHFKNKYADLGAVWDACREHLSSNGLSVMQFPDYDIDRKTVSVRTVIAHASGHAEQFTTRLPVQKPDAQGAGSAITYARRYALMAAVGIAPEDDDGNAASQSASVGASKNRASRDLYSELQADIASADSADALKMWVSARGKEIDSLPDDWRTQLRSQYADKLLDLKFGPEERDNAA